MTAELAHYVETELRRIGLSVLPVAEGAPDTFPGIVAELERAGRSGIIRVWSGGSDRTIWPTAAANYRFRALHDIQHVAIGAGFDAKGEAEACRYLVSTLPGPLRRRFGRLLWAEVAVQALHYTRTGLFPVDQVAFNRAVLEGSVKV